MKGTLNEEFLIYDGVMVSRYQDLLCIIFSGQGLHYGYRQHGLLDSECRGNMG